MSDHRAGSIAYWTGAIVLTLLGFLDLVGIGAPFFLTGLTMLAIGRWRHEPIVAWPALLGVWASVLGYVALAPMGCSTSATAVLRGTSVIREGPTVCSYLFGIVRYSGGNPSLRTPLLAGLALGLITTIAVRSAIVVIRRRRSLAGRS